MVKSRNLLLEFALELLEEKECPICKKKIDIYYGSSYFNINNGTKEERSYLDYKTADDDDKFSLSDLVGNASQYNLRNSDDDYRNYHSNWNDKFFNLLRNER